MGVSLGVEWDWSINNDERSAGVVVKVRLPQYKAEKYDARAAAILQRRKVSSAEARKLSSTLEYVCSAASNKKARAFARPIRDYESLGYSGRRPFTPEFGVALQSVRVLLQDRKWNPILGHAVARRFALLSSDGRGSNGIYGSEVLAAVLIMASGGAYTVVEASAEMVEEWLRHVTSEQRINECESIAALLGLATFIHHLQDVDVLHFVDSSAAQGVLIKGYSSSRTLSAVTSAYWTLAGKCRAMVWVGRVPSKLNVADGPTRGDYSVVQAHGWAWVPPEMPEVGPWSSLFVNLVPKTRRN